MGANLFFKNLKESVSKISRNIEETEEKIRFSSNKVPEDDTLMKLGKQEEDAMSMLENARSALGEMRKSRSHSEQHYIHLEGIVSIMDSKMASITNFLKDYGYEEPHLPESQNNSEPLKTEDKQCIAAVNNILNDVNVDSTEKLFKTPPMHIVKSSLFCKKTPQFSYVTNSNLHSEISEARMANDRTEPSILNTIQRPRSLAPVKSPVEPLLMSVRKYEDTQNYDNNTPDDTLVLNSKENDFQPQTPKMPKSTFTRSIQ